ncbi:MAG TPA: glutamine--tRNA ligase/YqeY domain fusion protein [Bacteroidales bacterium]|nr:MAG: Glutamine--tRNA ligase [Bacteroidetes bacterium ADurb.Bin217]HPM13255.1 glutamine--tRNA ligase/YqeY domain fusion protein [Bacteroidales bacterium]
MSNTEVLHEADDNEKKSLNFLEQIIEADLPHVSKIITRFPPEPNGYLHIGHAKSICLNFGLAQQYGGQCNLRFDDTNPTKEDIEYVDSIKEDVRWLGFNWGTNEFYASDYFQQLYDWAVLLIKKGNAYVCHMTAEEVSESRGTPTVPGKESPYRNRSVEENLDLFARMKNGEFKEGECMLRAKIDMASPNMHMRDPIMYRIRYAHHHKTGDAWCIYPMYDFAHGQSDFIEGITHSICTLEFEVHRPLYEWFLNHIAEPGQIRPKQREFARLNLTYTVMSKRKLLQLVEEKHVSGWDDPRMPTISGLRRRGFTPESVRNFAEKVGVSKRENIIDVALLEHCIREDLNKTAPRVMAVLQPLKVVITNYPEGKTEILQGKINPEDEQSGYRDIPFGRELYIEQSDFMEDAPKKFFRLSPGNEVRLKYAYIIKCENVIKDSQGNITEIHCTYDPDTKSGSGTEASQRKVKGTLHWVPVHAALSATVRLYDRLFMVEDPMDVAEGHDFLEHINPHSLEEVPALLEPSVADAQAGFRCQFERTGYFCVDKDSSNGSLIFNKTVGLKDSWAKIQK